MSNDNIPQKLDLLSFFPYRLSILEQLVSETVAVPYKQQYDLARNDWRVMATLALMSPVSATDIVSFTRLEKMQVSRAVQRLKVRGWLDAKQSRADKRAVDYQLTDAGIQVYNALVPDVKAKENEILSCLNPDERAELSRLIEKLDHALLQSHQPKGGKSSYEQVLG